MTSVYLIKLKCGLVDITTETSKEINPQYYNSVMEKWGNEPVTIDKTIAVFEEDAFPERYTLPEWMETEVAWTLGFILKYGEMDYRPYFFKRPYTLRVKVNKEQRLLLARAQKSLMTLGVGKLTRTETEIKSVDTDPLRVLYELLWYGGHKKVPKEILNAPEEIVSAFLEGYGGDGSDNDTNSNSVFPVLAVGISYLRSIVGAV